MKYLKQKFCKNAQYIENNFLHKICKIYWKYYDYFLKEDLLSHPSYYETQDRFRGKNKLVTSQHCSALYTVQCTADKDWSNPCCFEYMFLLVLNQFLKLFYTSCVRVEKLTWWFDEENIKVKFQRRRKGKVGLIKETCFIRRRISQTVRQTQSWWIPKLAIFPQIKEVYIFIVMVYFYCLKWRNKKNILCFK